MRLWYFSLSVKSFFKHASTAIQWSQLSVFGRTLRLLLLRLLEGRMWDLIVSVLDYCLLFYFQYFMCANSEGSGETARKRRLARAFACRLCDKYLNFMSWLKRNSFLNCKSINKGNLSHLMTKPTKWHARSAKFQISLGICPV